MKFQQYRKTIDTNWQLISGKKQPLKKPLVLVFGNRYLLEDANIYAEIKSKFPDGEIIIGSTAGEILGDNVTEGAIAVTAIEFEKSNFIVKKANILDFKKDAVKIGKHLFNQLPKENLKHIFVVSEGSFVNGSELIDGFEMKKSEQTVITGGLCGDDDRFEKTLVGYNENPKEGEIVAIGFYGDSLDISYAQYGGWTPFGPLRTITKSNGNLLHELDNLPALDLYMRYLGDKASQLPQSALLYPLSLKEKGKEQALVRTVLGIDQQSNTMTLAGNVPEGAEVQLMMANIDNIAEGAMKAAEIGMKNRNSKPELAILVSCIGRKLVMDQRVEEEIEEVIETVGKQATVCGFYSYGELAPFQEQTSCELHNQTMTLTLFSEQ